MELDIQYCNNIDSAKIIIQENKLNIKFAPNGTGKSTIAKAIQYSSAENDHSLTELTPFKYRDGNPDNNQPKINGAEHIKTVMCFNEDYVEQFTFKPDELVSNSFDIFIRTDVYKKTEYEINNIVEIIKQLFINNPDLETLISNLKELGAAFKLTKTGLSKASTVTKGLSDGNIIKHIPSGLESFKPFIQSDNCVSWIDWQTKGHKEFSNLSEFCPFCSSDSTGKKEQIKQVSEKYDKTIIKNLIGIINVIDKLGEYFSEDTKSRLAIITSLENGLENEHEQCIVTVKTQIDEFVSKLERLKTLSGFHFKEGEDITNKLKSFKLDLQFFSELNSNKTHEAITSINNSIDNLINQAGMLQGGINKQRREMQRLVKKHEKNFNNFLIYAGYRYKVQISGDNGRSQLKLLHIDHNQHLSGGDQHLSFGERNAFAIVLFMYECLAKNPDLIILDDPISSFDKNKKFAILEMLFRRDADACLKGKTVLMLTHDMEPIIDTLKSVKKVFSNQVAAYYLLLRNNHIVEQPIKEKDIKTFAQICQLAIKSDCDDIIKLIYLRRYYEILDDKSDAYQIISNLLKGRTELIDTRENSNTGDQRMDLTATFYNGCQKIKEDIPEFDYFKILNDINDTNLKALYKSSQNGYEKLQVFRLFTSTGDKNSVIKKFIDETYHIENEFICQLNPTQFDFIPEYVIEECNKLLDI